jgi:hypothetical protein
LQQILLKLVDISGLGHSGKTAVTDLIREVKGVHVHHSSFEFDLLRLPDGILELQQALCVNWSPSRSDFAIKRFKRLCEALNDHYSEMLTSKFMQYTDEYIESLILDRLYVDKWYDSLYEKNSFKLKAKSKLKKFGVFSIAASLFNVYKSINTKKNEVHLSDGKDFVEKTKLYLEKILFHHVDYNVRAIVTNNAFEVFSPCQNFNFFEEAHSIIVNRDPRDIFASAHLYLKSYKPDSEVETYRNNKNKIIEHLNQFLGLTNINTFIKRQKLYRKKMILDNENLKPIYVNYEDLVLNYEEVVREIFVKINLKSKEHVDKKKYFNPELSLKNVGIWKKMKDSEEIKLIEIELKDALYCY